MPDALGRSVTYSERFSDLAGEPTGIITERTARGRDRTGKPYTVTLGAPRDPDRVLEVCWHNRFLGVWFFDQPLRRSVHYSFDRRDTEREPWLFLHEMIVWTYPKATARLLNECSAVRRVRFTPEGIIRDSTRDHTTHREEIVDTSDVDVASHWEPVPVFGQWSSVSRHDRTAPAGE